MKFEAPQLGNEQEISEIDSQESSENEHLEYLHPTREELLKARNIIQAKIMARLYGFDVNDDPDPAKTEIIDKDWIGKGYASQYAEIINKTPELLLKYLHSGKFANSLIDSDDVVDEVLSLLKEKHEVHA